ncbi:MAG TPA: hypothetical protein GYA07_03705 [Verrucomicrobia bacterium]|nr:hypothetical protein [Verrucomicrobiota bacterium]HOB33699.1 hypothetical protein [Verrucomicrobiota bacterium]HOP96861.1 hypothetical protein [Verrucomicrobiota bacterium]HPU56227.1 hypothetical protein [Verrucomicrobiota bacterium]
MQKEAQPKVLLYQSVGFLAIIVLSWLDELVNLRALIFEHNFYIADFQELILKMLFILAVWLLVGNATRRILEHVKYLEGFMKVCAWCRRIDYRGRWMPLEEFLQQGFDTPTSHGICKECLEIQKSILEAARQKEASLPSGNQQESTACPP